MADVFNPPEDCYCNQEESESGYTYRDEYGDCEACLAFKAMLERAKLLIGGKMYTAVLLGALNGYPGEYAVSAMGTNGYPAGPFKTIDEAKKALEAYTVGAGKQYTVSGYTAYIIDRENHLIVDVAQAPRTPLMNWKREK